MSDVGYSGVANYANTSLGNAQDVSAGNVQQAANVGANSVAVSPNFVRDSLAILRRPGIEAHVYLPGIGTLSGLAAANYLDSALTTPATVDNPVGGVVDAIGVINATQPTTAAKPILRQTAGKYSWAFDGGDSLALGSVPFQMSDDHAVIAGASTSSTATQQGILCLANSGTTNPVISLQLNSSGKAEGFWRDDAGVNAVRTGTLTVSGQFVASIRRTGGASPTVSVSLNGVRTAELSTSGIGTTTLNTATVGAWVRTSTQFYLTGSTGPILAIKGTVSDADLLSLERLVSSLTPNGPVF